MCFCSVNLIDFAKQIGKFRQIFNIGRKKRGGEAGGGNLL